MVTYWYKTPPTTFDSRNAAQSSKKSGIVPSDSKRPEDSFVVRVPRAQCPDHECSHLHLLVLGLQPSLKSAVFGLLGHLGCLEAVLFSLKRDSDVHYDGLFHCSVDDYQIGTVLLWVSRDFLFWVDLSEFHGNGLPYPLQDLPVSTPDQAYVTMTVVECMGQSLWLRSAA